MVGGRRGWRRAGRFVLGAYAVLVIAFLLLPIAIVVPMSLNEAALFEIIPSNPSLSQYRRLFASPDWMDVLFRSLRIAATVMIVTAVLGTLAAAGLARLGGRRRPFLEALFLSPQIVPSIVIAAAAYYFFAILGFVGSTIGIVIAHVVLALPFVVVMVGSRLQTIGPELSQASASLGAGPFVTFYRITLPQLRTAVIGSCVLAFHVSFDEVVLALFLSGPRNKTLPVKLWESILFEITPILPAISTVVLAVPLVLFLGLLLMRGKRVQREA